MDKKQSRQDAKTFRGDVMDRCKGRCEVCRFICAPIMHLHHVLPVADGGDGLPDNLIALCPNCHSAIHQIRKVVKSGDDNYLELIGSWTLSAYTVTQSNLLGSVAFCTAQLIDNKWIAFDSPFSIEV